MGDRRIGLWASLCAMLGVGSCSNDTAPPPRIPHAQGCEVESDCDPGLTCTKRNEARGGLCHVDCESSASCGVGERCVHTDDTKTAAVCQLAVEAQCLYDSDCFTPLTCAPDQQCREACKQDVDCISPQACVVGKDCPELEKCPHFCAEPHEVSQDGKLLVSRPAPLPSDGSDGIAGGEAGGAPGEVVTPGGLGGGGSNPSSGGDATDAEGGAGVGGGSPVTTNPCAAGETSCNSVEIVLEGTGKGRVRSEPAGIDCGVTCSADFPATRGLVLLAEPDIDSIFSGWSGGGCGASPRCVLTPSTPAKLTATFSPPFTGNVAWIKSTPQVDGGATVDANGNVTIAGINAGPPLPLGGPSPVSTGSFAAGFGSAGTWSWQLEGLLGGSPNGVTTDATGDVLIAIGGGAVHGATVNGDCNSQHTLVAKLDRTNGAVRWAQCLWFTAKSVALGALRDGDVIVEWTNGDLHAFMRLSASTGDVVWQLLDVTGRVLSLAIDADDNVLVAGSEPTSSYGADAFIEKRDADGAFVWHEGFGGTADDDIRAITTDAAGDVYFTGEFRQQPLFDGVPFVSSGGSDIIVGEYSPAGTLVWKNAYGNNRDETGRSILHLPNGNLLVSGMVNNSIDMGQGFLDAPGQRDVFVAELSPDGKATLFSKGYGSSGDDDLALEGADSSGTILYAFAAGGTVTLDDQHALPAGLSFVRMTLP
jgi:hypothetical protein